MNEKGLSLIEILASTVILSIIIVSLLTFFVQSSKTNHYSKDIIDATYIAQNTVEEINYQISNSEISKDTTSEFLREFSLSNPYTKKCTDGTCYEKTLNTNGRYVFIKLSPKDELIVVNVEVYNNHTDSKKQEAKMEMLISWKK